MKNSRDSVVFAPVLIEHPSYEDPWFRAYNLDDEKAVVIARGENIQQCIEVYKETQQTVLCLIKENNNFPNKEDSIGYLKLLPKFFLAVDKNKHLTEESFPILICKPKEEIKDFTAFSASDSPVGCQVIRGDSFELVEKEWKEKYDDIFSSMFYYECDEQ